MVGRGAPGGRGERANHRRRRGGRQGAAIVAAVDALVVVASDRGRQECRLTVADTQMIIFPGLTVEGNLDLESLQDTRRQLTYGM